jgi:hypothetical protein
VAEPGSDIVYAAVGNPPELLVWPELSDDSGFDGAVDRVPVRLTAFDLGWIVVLCCVFFVDLILFFFYSFFIFLFFWGVRVCSWAYERVCVCICICICRSMGPCACVCMCAWAGPLSSLPFPSA